MCSGLPRAAEFREYAAGLWIGSPGLSLVPRETVPDPSSSNAGGACAWLERTPRESGAGSIDDRPKDCGCSRILQIPLGFRSAAGRNPFQESIQKSSSAAVRLHRREDAVPGTRGGRATPPSHRSSHRSGKAGSSHDSSPLQSRASSFGGRKAGTPPCVPERRESVPGFGGKRRRRAP